MLGCTQRSLLLARQHSLFTISTTRSRLLWPVYCIPYQLWSQMSQKTLTSGAQKSSKTPSKESLEHQPSQSATDDVVSKKLFVVTPGPSNSLSSLDKPSVAETCSNVTLPPKPIQENHNCRKDTEAGQGNLTKYFYMLKTKLMGWYCSLTTRNWKEMLPSRSLTAGNILSTENINLLRQGAVAAWNITVSTVQNVIYWIGVFRESREYFYLRYYSLLFLESVVHYTRRGLLLTVRAIKDKMKK